MKKAISSIIVSIILSLSFFNLTFADTLDLKGDPSAGVTKGNYVDNAKGWFGSNFFGGTQTGEKGVSGLLFNIAWNLKNVFIAFSVIYLFVLVLRLFFAGGSDEDLKKWRMGILWTTIGIVLMQIAYVAVVTIYDQDITGATAKGIIENILTPLIRLLEVIVSFIFIGIAIMAFYKIITSGGNDEGYKKGVSSIINAIIGFILVKISAKLVYSIYGDIKCIDGGFGTQTCSVSGQNISETTRIITSVIQYATGFVTIAIILFTIYASFLLLTSQGEDAKRKKAITIIKFLIFGILMIVSSVLIFNFMLGKDLSGIIGSFK